MTDPANGFRLEDVVVRHAVPEDQEVARELFLAGMVEGQLRGGDTGADIEHLAATYLADGGASGFWIAEHRGAVVGMIGVLNTRDNVAEIKRLRVRESHRRRGIGAVLMQHAIEFCRRQGYLKVVLDVRVERSPAVALFEKFGFSLTRSREIEGHRTLDFYLDLYRDFGDGH